MRQIHHWSALIFMASIVVHMMRHFFTGSFRKPHELTWLVGMLLMIIGLAAGFTGCSLPDDVLSGNGLRITDGVIKAIPLVGSFLSVLVFGGEFPGDHIVPHLFTLHIFVVPGLLTALIGLHPPSRDSSPTACSPSPEQSAGEPGRLKSETLNQSRRRKS